LFLKIYFKMYIITTASIKVIGSMKKLKKTPVKKDAIRCSYSPIYTTYIVAFNNIAMLVTSSYVMKLLISALLVISNYIPKGFTCQA